MVCSLDSISIAKNVFESEIEALGFVRENLDEAFDFAVQLILACTGRVIVCGMGKSGIVGKKISASFSSTGTPSFFVHPAEAIHGDLGMISSGDVFVGISYSGETGELVSILPYLKDSNVPIIALTSGRDSSLGRSSEVFLDVSVPAEACPLQLAPTSSSTAALVLGDALTVALMEARGFTAENFARFHPGGALGRKLTSSIRQEMVAEIPMCKLDSDFMSVLEVVTHGGLGLCVVLGADGLKGVITDGDIRRCMSMGIESIQACKACDMMTENPIFVNIDESMVSALSLMESKNINRLLVLEAGVAVGVLKK